MWNGKLDEAQAGIKIARRNINNVTYADDTAFTVETQEELMNLLMKMKEWKSWLKTQHSKNEDHGIRSHHSMVNRQGPMETVTNLIFLISIITADGDCGHEIKRCLLLGKKAMTNLDNKLKSRGVTLPPDAKSQLIGKDPDDWRQEEKGVTEDKVIGWQPWLNGHAWASSGRWWRTGKPGMLQPIGLQRADTGE